MGPLTARRKYDVGAEDNPEFRAFQKTYDAPACDAASQHIFNQMMQFVYSTHDSLTFNNIIDFSPINKVNVKF